jgi:adenosine deaminase
LTTTFKRKFTRKYEPIPKMLIALLRFFPLFSSYIYKLCNNISSIEYSTKSVLQEFEADGVVWLELRTTPRDIPASGLTKGDYIRTVLTCLNDYNDDSETRLCSRLILSIDRRMSDIEAEEIVDLAIVYAKNGVVGIDLCGDPSKGDVKTFTNAFERAKKAGLKLTIHFAEALSSSTDRELSTILDWHPDRLGHVIYVKDKIKADIVARNIGVELCLSCNIHAKMITGTYSDHHFGWWKDSPSGVALSVR